MKRQNLLWLLTVFVATTLLTSFPIFAQRPRESCPDIPQVTPTQETREIANQEFEFKFKIPANYRTERRQEDNQLSILLRNPADVELLECCRRTRENWLRSSHFRCSDSGKTASGEFAKYLESTSGER